MTGRDLFLLGALALAGCGPTVSLDSPVLAGGATSTDSGEETDTPPAPTVVHRVDRVVQPERAQLDVLWVIDDSCSMSEEQAALARDMPSFMQHFLGSYLDYHIGVVTTDTQNPSKSGRLRQAFGYRWIDADMDEDLQLSMFSELVVQGTGGSDIETGRRAVYRALTEPLLSGHNAGFYRASAALSIIVVTDEDDDSGNNPNRNEFIRFLLALKSTEDDVTFSHISGDLPNGCSGPGGSADPAREYHAVTNAVGGVWHSICEDDWTPILNDLGPQVIGPSTEFSLSTLPVPESIEVQVEDGDHVWEGVNSLGLTPEQRGGGDAWRSACGTSLCFVFDYDAVANAIVILEYVPAPGAEIVITYELADQDD